jgi:hypothetical protein
MLLENKFKILLGGKIILVSGYFPTASTMQFSFIKDFCHTNSGKGLLDYKELGC